MLLRLMELTRALLFGELVPGHAGRPGTDDGSDAGELFTDSGDSSSLTANCIKLNVILRCFVHFHWQFSSHSVTCYPHVCFFLFFFKNQAWYFRN